MPSSSPETGSLTSCRPRGCRPGPSSGSTGYPFLPGLINCHVHLCLGAEADPAHVPLNGPLGLTALKAACRARQTVEAGVTTVRDLGGRDYVEFSVRRAIYARNAARALSVSYPGAIKVKRHVRESRVDRMGPGALSDQTLVTRRFRGRQI